MRARQLLIKPVSAYCDLQCRYCFYKDVEKHRSGRTTARMSDDVMQAVVEYRRTVGVWMSVGQTFSKNMNFWSDFPWMGCVKAMTATVWGHVGRGLLRRYLRRRVFFGMQEFL